MDLLIPLALAALLIFFLFNSRRKQKARAEQIKTGLVPGATVMTTFGVFGTVLSIDEETNQVTIESGPGTVLRVHRQAIGQIDSGEAAAGPIDAPAADDAGSTAAGAGAAGSVATGEAAESGSEKPAITDAELDAMNARKRENGEDDAESVDSTDVDSLTDADAAAGDSKVSDLDAADDKDSTIADTDVDSSDLVAESDAPETDSVDADAADTDIADSDSADTDTDKKN